MHCTHVSDVKDFKANFNFMLMTFVDMRLMQTSNFRGTEANIKLHVPSHERLLNVKNACYDINKYKTPLNIISCPIYYPV